MRAASFAEAAHQDGVGGFEENNLRRNHAPDRFQDSGKLFQLGAFAHVHDKRGAADLTGLHSQVGKLRDELHRQVIDAVVAQILERL